LGAAIRLRSCITIARLHGLTERSGRGDDSFVRTRAIRGRRDVAKPTKQQLTTAAKALRNPRTREVNETKAAKTLAAGRKRK